MLTRTEGRDWIILQAEDTGYGVKTPTVLRWADSFCAQMVQGKGPQVAPTSDLVPAYATAAVGKKFPIGAYIGVPLMRADGALFGTLCAIHPEPLPEAIKAELPLISLFSQLLSSLLNAEQELNKQIRLTERAETEALDDPVTGCYDTLTDLFNVNGWWQLLDTEEYRCGIYGSPASVFSLKIDDDVFRNNTAVGKQKEDFLLRVSRAFFEVTQPEDVIAQIGENSFAILAVECNADGARALLDRLNSIFQKACIPISIGYAARHPSKGLRSAWREAEEALDPPVQSPLDAK